MPWMSLEFKPGIVKDRTKYSSYGTWVDGSLVRFRDGLPESWLGWQKGFDDFEFEGKARSLYRYSDLVGFSWVGMGTNARYYMLSDDVNYEVTPYIRQVAPLGADPLSVTSGSAVITVTDTGHGRQQETYVDISGATTVAGIPDTEINAQHRITGIVSPDEYTIEVTTTASSTTTGGGSSVAAKYLLFPGSEDQITGGGWGSLGWGDEEWGGDPDLGIGDRIGIWTESNWGEDLVACPQGGAIYYWDRSAVTNRMIDINDLPGADGNAPTECQFILVSHRDRHLLAFGCSEFSTGTYNPMTFRWCSQENVLNWDEADTTGTAGSLPLSHGSRFIAGISTTREMIVWSDTTMYSIQFIGAPLIFSADVIEGKSDIASLKAAAVTDSVVFWMGRSGFYAYTGRVEKLNCPVWEYVSGRINYQQVQKVYTATNRRYGEVIWFYPSLDGDGENDSYVAYDHVNGVWTIGSLARTAWLDGDSLHYPIAAAPDNYVYYHEIGASDGSTTPETPINAYLESAPLELSSEGSYDRGDRMMFVRRILPDVTFRGVGANPAVPSVRYVLKMMDKPGGAFDDTSSSQVTRSAIVPVEEFTTEAHVRLRGRALVLRFENYLTDTAWRIGVTRIDARTDGQR